MGGGLAGCSLGALLSKSGHKTLILEATEKVGGRASSDDFYGVPLDFGIHAVLLGQKSSIKTIFNKLGIDINIIKIGMSLFRDNKVRKFIGPSIISLLNSELFSIRDLARLILNILIQRNKKALFRESLESWSTRTKTKGSIVDFLKCMSIGLLVQKDFDKVPIGQLFSYLSLVFKTGGLVGYPNGGWESIWDGLLKVIKNSAKCSLQTKEIVKKIHINDGKVISIDTNKKNYEARYFVCAFPPNLLIDNNILDGNQINKRTLSSLIGCKLIYGLNIDFLLSKKISQEKNLIFTVDPPTLSSFPSNASPNLAKGCAQIFTCFYPIGTKKPEKEKAEELLDWLENFYDNVFPGLKKYTIHSRRLVVPVIGAEFSTNFNFLDRIKVNPPDFQNLLFIGDCVRSTSSGGETSMKSALKAWNIIRSRSFR